MTHAHDSDTRGRHINWASHYDVFGQLISFGGIGKVRKRTIELSDLSPGMYVVELGCGTADLALRAKRIVSPSGRVIATDPSDSMVSEARRKAQNQALDIEFLTEGMQALRLPDASADRIIASLSIHHILSEDRDRAFGEMIRILKTGGKFVIVDFEGARTRFGRLFMRATMHGSGPQIISQAEQWFAEAGIKSMHRHDLPFPGLQALIGTKA